MSNVENVELVVFSEDLGHVWHKYDHQSQIVFVNQGNKFEWGEKINFDDDSDLEEWINEMKENCLAFLPLWIFDHSGIKFELYPSCPWDSAHIGFIYIKKNDEVLFHLETEEEALKVINQELDELNLYYSEGWFGYYLSNLTTDSIIDRLTGFLGLDAIENGLKENLNPKYHHLIQEALETIF